MIRLTFSIELRYEIAGQSADFVFNIHAARTPCQSVVSEGLIVTPPLAYQLQEDAALGNRYLRLRASPGPVWVRYDAVVDIQPHLDPPEHVHEMPIADLPPEVLPYIYPSRYCQSDRLRRLATREFGHLRTGYARVQAIHDWVRGRTAFASGSSNSSTSATDTLVEQVGVCRDFAHLMIALLRALNIPARFVTAIDYGAAIELGPTDFHAFVEVYLGERWYSFDPTGITAPMGLVRIGTGRDAADVSFATIFGTVSMPAPIIAISALDDPANGFVLPQHTTQALSTSR